MNFKIVANGLMKKLSFIYTRNEHVTTYSVPQAHKYEKYETENTNTDYEYINRRKRSYIRPYIDLKFRQVSTRD